MGNISIVISVAPALGPTISGLILNYLHWRWLFILVLPIALAALAVGALRIRNVTTPRYAPLDAVSVVFSAVGFGGLLAGHTATLVVLPVTPLVATLILGAVAAMLTMAADASVVRRPNARLTCADVHQ